jgi:hypothetical protein
MAIMAASLRHPIIANIQKAEIENQIRLIVGKMVVQYNIGHLPDEVRMNILLDYIWDNCQTLTVEEVEEANKLNLREPENTRINPFGAISVDFVSKLVLRYRQRKTEAVKAFNQAKAALIEPKYDRETPEQALNGLIEFYKREKAIPVGWNWSSCFDALYADGKAGTMETLTQFFELTKKQVTAEIKAKVATAANLIEKRQLELQLHDANMKYEARKRFVQEWVVNNVEHE